MEHLRTARGVVSEGFHDKSRLLKDDAFAHARMDPDFNRLLGRMES